MALNSMIDDMQMYSTNNKGETRIEFSLYSNVGYIGIVDHDLESEIMIKQEDLDEFLRGLNTFAYNLPPVEEVEGN